MKVRVNVTGMKEASFLKIFKTNIDSIYVTRRPIEIIDDDEDDIRGNIFIISGKQLYIFNLFNWEGSFLDDPLSLAKTKDGYTLFQETVKTLKAKPELVPSQYNKIFMYALMHCVTNTDNIPYLLSINVPTMFKTVKEKYLYRGLVLSEKGVEDLREGKTVPLKARPISNWTTKQSIAEMFANSGPSKKGARFGVVIKIPSRSLDVILNYNNPIFKKFGLDLEKEVLVKGEGVKVITPKDVVYGLY